ncbi:Transcriptional regulator [uncultured Defluviicoccus sp.]|uniref:Transcriptional regulator n=1 Tax=metagenome TaxID=256318 RepID=A0A380THH5_9ZZZZ|nr:Transcriptional regulator [uncultured Defluviicoccus sp.]
MTKAPATPMATTTLHISLPEELKRYVQERVAAEAYSNPSDFVRALIREDRKRRGQEHLEALLLEGLESGEAQPLDEAEWASVRQEIEEGIAAQRRSA